MATDPSASAREPFSDYEKLVAEYRDCKINCEAGLDQLRAAERDLRAEAAKRGCDFGVNVSGEIEEALRQIVDRNRLFDADAVAKLSSRECKVFELIGHGMPTSSIAACLNIATSTVDTYRQRLKDKLSLETGLELTRFAILWFAIRENARCIDSDGRDVGP